MKVRYLTEKEIFHNLIQYSEQKQDDCRCIDDMHDPKIKAVGSIRILFSKKIHDTKLRPVARNCNTVVQFFQCRATVYHFVRHSL